jgi:hypothetical protein
MKNLISGETADDCYLKTIKYFQRHNCAVSEHPLIICLTNPLARFSFFPGKDLAASLVLGLAALAGINADDIITAFGITRPFLPGPYLRGFSSDTKPYQVTLKNAGTRIGTVDQFSNAITLLSYPPADSFAISLLDPKKSIDPGIDVPASLRLYLDEKEALAASVYVPEMYAERQLDIIPTYTFIQQMAAALLGKNLGKFYILSDRIKIGFGGDTTYNDILDQSLPCIEGMKDFRYRESKAFDMRYLDMAVQHIFGFLNRIKKDGDIFTENPFKASAHSEHLEVFYDYCEAFRYCEATDRDLSWEGKPDIKHPQLAYYYDF